MRFGRRDDVVCLWSHCSRERERERQRERERESVLCEIQNRGAILIWRTWNVCSVSGGMAGHLIRWGCITGDKIWNAACGRRLLRLFPTDVDVWMIAKANTTGRECQDRKEIWAAVGQAICESIRHLEFGSRRCVIFWQAQIQGRVNRFMRALEDTRFPPVIWKVLSA